jgi:hypothetical protein
MISADRGRGWLRGQHLGDDLECGAACARDRVQRCRACLALEDPSMTVRASAALSIGDPSVRGRVLSTSADDTVRLSPVTEGLDAKLLLRTAARPFTQRAESRPEGPCRGLDEIDGVESLVLDEELALDPSWLN